VNIPALNTAKIYAYLDTVSKRAESYFNKHEEERHEEHHKVVVTSPIAKDVIITQKYVCQIHSQQKINIQALETGYLKPIPIKEGQAVKKGDLLFEIVPILFKAKLEAEEAEVQHANLEYIYTKKLFETKVAGAAVVSQSEVNLLKAKLAKAEARKKLAEAEFNFTTLRAPFDGIVDKLHDFEGSLIKEGDILTTLSDNRVMWVYFNVPEKRYLEYMAELGEGKAFPDIELELANQAKFPHTGKIDLAKGIGAIEANFNNETGNIAFRADFPNPKRLLRNGQTGTVLINRVLKDAIVIPQRATFENLAKQYVYVVDKDDVVRQRDIVIQYELDDIFVIQEGLDVHDRIILEGIRQVRDGEKVEYEFLAPEKVLGHLKFHAE
jgi:membrane fusion protein (multidrug efflux system)